jgi:DNA modification methylase
MERHTHPSAFVAGGGEGRNMRAVWTIPSRAFRGAHFATFPEALVETPIRAGSPEGGLVLDPFMGSGTTAVVARRLGRHSLGIELNPAYIELAKERLADSSYAMA